MSAPIAQHSVSSKVQGCRDSSANAAKMFAARAPRRRVEQACRFAGKGPVGRLDRTSLPFCKVYPGCHEHASKLLSQARPTSPPFCRVYPGCHEHASKALSQARHGRSSEQARRFLKHVGGGVDRTSQPFRNPSSGGSIEQRRAQREGRHLQPITTPSDLWDC